MEAEDVLRFPIRGGGFDVRIRKPGMGPQEYLLFSRPREAAKAFGSKVVSIELPCDQIESVSLRSTRGFVFSCKPKPEAESLLADSNWPVEQLSVSLDVGPKRDVERAMTRIIYRYLVGRLGLMEPAPHQFIGLNGRIERSASTLTLSSEGTLSADLLPPLVSQTYDVAEIVDVYLFDVDMLTCLMIFDRFSVETLLGGETTYAWDRTLRADVGDWPRLASFYEMLPRFGNRPAADLKEPDDAVVNAAYNSWLLSRSSTGSGTTAPTGTSIAGELRQLAELHESGALTDTEFEAAKSRLLS